MKTAISTRALLLTSALLLSPLALAQNGGTQSEEEQAKREALRAELQAARTEMAQAAREMARLQRELVEEDARQGRWTMKMDGNENENVEIIVDSDHDVQFYGITPKLGILVSGGGDSGKEVLGLTPGGGAEAAGLQRGDRVVEVNGLALDNEGNSIGKALEGLEAGATVPVVVERNGSSMSFDVTTSAPDRDIRAFAYRFGPDVIADLGFDTEDFNKSLEGIEREIVMMREGGFPHPPEAPHAPRLPGLFVLGGDSDLVSNHDGLAPYFGTGDGVIVLRIGNDNPLQLTDGDVILSIDGEPVSRPADLGRVMLEREPGDTMLLEVMRNGTLNQVEGTVPSAFSRTRFVPKVGMDLPRPPRPERPARPAAPAPTSMY